MSEPYNGWTHERILEKLSEMINEADCNENYRTGDDLFEIIIALKTEWGMSLD